MPPWEVVLLAALSTLGHLFATTLVFSGPLGIGTDLGSPVAALGVMIGLPLALGFTLDVLYIPPPEEYDLPDRR